MQSCFIGAILNPSYKSMHLYGSEYHTYFLPERVGKIKAQELLSRSSPLHSADCLEMGMFDEVMGDGVENFRNLVEEKAKQIVLDKPQKEQKTSKYFEELEKCREAELERMAIDFTTDVYMESRKAFVLH